MNTNLTKKQEEFLELLPIGREVHVATSEYSIDRRGDWKPITRYTAQAMRSLISKGFLEGDFYWRGATVKRLK